MEDCLDRVVTKEIVFSQPMDRGWVLALDQLGKLEYYGHFPKPFFRVTKPTAYVLKGVEGHDRCQVVFLEHTAALESDLVERLNNLNLDHSSGPEQ
jgi:hypothetical protein